MKFKVTIDDMGLAFWPADIHLEKIDKRITWEKEPRDGFVWMDKFANVRGQEGFWNMLFNYEAHKHFKQMKDVPLTIEINIVGAFEEQEAQEEQWAKQHEEIENMKDEKCPHCGIALELKMFDIDGTNLEEHAVCPECKYGQPALM
jgi:hypothetical protein